MPGDKELPVVERYEPGKRVKAGLETSVSGDKLSSRHMCLVTKRFLSLRHLILTCLRDSDSD